jgi:hypothetical protein
VLTAAWVIDERRPKAGDAGSGGAADAGIDNSIRPFEEEPGGEGLRGGVALRDGFRLEAILPLRGSEGMEGSGEVGEEFDVIEDERSLDAGVGEEAAAVKGDFGDGGFEFEAGVPGATLGAVEAAAERAGVGEGGVDDVGLGHAEEQFAGTDGGIGSALGDFALVGGGVELAEVGQNIGGQREGFKDAGACLIRKPGGDEPVGSCLVELFEKRQ